MKINKINFNKKGAKMKKLVYLVAVIGFGVFYLGCQDNSNVISPMIHSLYNQVDYQEEANF